MTKGILGRKVGMTQIFTKDGVLVPVTVVESASFGKSAVLSLRTMKSAQKLLWIHSRKVTL